MLKKIFKWIMMIILFLFGIALILIMYAYSYSNKTIIKKKYEVTPTEFSVSKRSSENNEGIRLAKIHGCLSCHGSEGDGRVIMSIPMVFSAKATNLTHVVNNWSEVELENSIRQGIRRDGSTHFFMPSQMYHHLSDKDLSAIILALRELPVSEGNEKGGTFFGPVMRLMMTYGSFDFMGQKPTIDTLESRMNPPAPNDLMALGKYKALTTCTECHGTDLKGGQLGEKTPPNLSVVRAFNLENFATLMQTGIGPAGGEGMKEVSSERFSHFSDEEVKALYTYLTSL
jgi:cytochrome c553